MHPTHMQRIDALCSDIWSEHGDAIGTYAPYGILLRPILCVCVCVCVCLCISVYVYVNVYDCVCVCVPT
jgi:hypothetical protein